MKKGFTLIELLVVIAIIAILAAILFPVFARAREKARQTSCLNNVKQLALGAHMYFQDYDERTLSYRHERPGNTSIKWQHMMLPYVKNSQLYLCPSGDRTYGSGTVATSHYGWNYYYLFFIAIAEITEPAETFMVGEKVAEGGGVGSSIRREMPAGKRPTWTFTTPPASTTRGPTSPSATGMPSGCGTVSPANCPPTPSTGWPGGSRQPATPTSSMRQQMGGCARPLW